MSKEKKKSPFEEVQQSGKGTYEQRNNQPAPEQEPTKNSIEFGTLTLDDYLSLPDITREKALKFAYCWNPGSTEVIDRAVEMAEKIKDPFLLRAFLPIKKGENACRFNLDEFCTFLIKGGFHVPVVVKEHLSKIIKEDLKKNEEKLKGIYAKTPKETEPTIELPESILIAEFGEVYDEGYEEAFSESKKLQKKLASERGKKGGEKPKFLQGVLEATLKTLSVKKSLSASQVWQKLSKYNSHNPLSTGNYEIYVDGDNLTQVHETTRQIKSIKRSTHKGYVSKAKKILPS